MLWEKRPFIDVSNYYVDRVIYQKIADRTAPAICVFKQNRALLASVYISNNQKKCNLQSIILRPLKYKRHNILRKDTVFSN